MAETATFTATDSAANSPQTVSLTGTGVAQVTLSAATLAFGNEGIGTTSTAKTITVTNNTSASVTISGTALGGTNATEFVQSGATCGASLAGHASCTVSVKFAPATVGPKTAALAITDTAANNPQSVNLTGTGVQPVTLSAATLNFGNQGFASTSAAKPLTLTNNNSVALNFTGILINGANGSDFIQSATTCGTTLAGHTSCTISVTFTPSTLAPETAALTVTDDAGNSPQSAALTGTGVAQITLSATTIGFGNQASGTTSAAKNVTLTNNTSAAVTISSVIIGGANGVNFAESATSCGASLNGHSSCTFSFTFTPSTTNPETATASINDSATNSPQIVTLTGTGLVPVSVTPATLTYASQTVGTTSAAKTVTVKNNLPTTLTISGITITGPNKSDFAQLATTCGSSLGSGASCTVSVTFKPTATLARTAALNVADSASTSPQTVALSGTGK
jgi:trimeric autotransporter adhesin